MKGIYNNYSHVYPYIDRAIFSFCIYLFIKVKVYGMVKNGIEKGICIYIKQWLI